jgi:hypothetical protein
MIPATAKAAAQRRSTMGPHPDIRFFVDPKDGIFKPVAGAAPSAPPLIPADI